MSQREAGLKQKPIHVIALLAACLFLSSFIPAWGGRLVSFALLASLGAFLFLRFPNKSDTSRTPDTLPDQPSQFVIKEGLKFQEEVPLQCLTREYRLGQRRETEAALSVALGSVLKAIGAAIDCHTAAIFFVGKTNGVYLRAWYSQNDEQIIPGAVISPGQGLVGVMAKEAGSTKIENDLVSNSRTLYYYKENVGVRSFLGVPIMIDGLFRGAITLDHTEPGRFTEKHLETLKEFSATIGHLCLQSYLQLEHRIDRERVAALKNMERDFLDMVSVREILERLAEVTGRALEYDRLTIALKGVADEAEVVLVRGEDPEFFQNFKFSLREAGVITLALAKNVAIQREFEAERYTPRFTAREKVNSAIRSIVIEPLGSKVESLGVLSLESRNPHQYGKVDCEVLRNLTTAASVALVKARMLEAMQTLATRDGLTGLANHREFQNMLNMALRAATRYQHSLALVMTDIDYFKKVNDTQGHPAGDMVLKEISRLLQSCVRQGVDSVARYGGEEFAIILSKADEQMMLETAERIRAAVEKLSISIGLGKSIQTTMSFGCALFPENARTQKEIIDCADKALYRAKHTGRNRVVKAT